MNRRIIMAMGIAMLLGACTGNKTANNETTEMQQASADIRGQWNLENIVVSDSVDVRPAEIVPESKQYITFEDSTYFIQTNCNTFSGAYFQNGDSIILDAGIMTEMACDNMATEDAIRSILPNIATLEMESDSILRLNGSSPAQYILLRKANDKE